MQRRILSSRTIIPFLAVSLALFMIPATSSLADIQTGLVAYYPMDGNAYDMSENINPNDGTAYNVDYVAGKLGEAAKFNGVNAYIRVPTSGILNPSEISISTWIFPTKDNIGVIVSKWGDMSGWYNQRAYCMHTMPGKVMRFATSDAAHQLDGRFHSFDTSTNSITLNAWNHVVSVYDGSTGTRKIYVDSNEVAARTDSPIDLFHSNADLSIGIQLRTPGLTNVPFSGLIDDVRIYNRALEPEEIEALYKLGDEPQCDLNSPPMKIVYGNETKDSECVGGTAVHYVNVGLDPKDNGTLTMMVQNVNAINNEPCEGCYAYGFEIQAEGKKIKSDSLLLTMLTKETTDVKLYPKKPADFIVSFEPDYGSTVEYEGAGQGDLAESFWFTFGPALNVARAGAFGLAAHEWGFLDYVGVIADAIAETGTLNENIQNDTPQLPGSSFRARSKKINDYDTLEVSSGVTHYIDPETGWHISLKIGANDTWETVQSIRTKDDQNNFVVKPGEDRDYPSFFVSWVNSNWYNETISVTIGDEPVTQWSDYYNTDGGFLKAKK